MRAAMTDPVPAKSAWTPDWSFSTPIFRLSALAAVARNDDSIRLARNDLRLPMAVLPFGVFDCFAGRAERSGRHLTRGSLFCEDVPGLVAERLPPAGQQAHVAADSDESEACLEVATGIGFHGG